MTNKIWFWLKNSRLFSLPMTLLSWLVIFIYTFDGNKLNGIIALIGISFAHLATNLFDDYTDYKNLDENCQQCKCAYIKEGKAQLKDVLNVVIIYLTVAFICGVYLLWKCGAPVAALAITGGVITLCYSKFSLKGLSETAVGIAFGPLLFEGVYFVMKGEFSAVVFVMSLAVVMFTIGLMYVHTVLDYEGDLSAHKKTLACRSGSKSNAINGVYFVYFLGYFFTAIFAVMTKNYYVFLTFLLIPLVFDLHKSLKTFRCGEESKEFYYRLLKARNLMVFYCIILCCVIAFK